MSAKYLISYKHGYINFDDDYLYVSNSGNWGELKNVNVLNGRATTSNFIAYLLSFVLVCIAFRSWQTIIFISIVLLAANFTSIFSRFTKGPTFKVPYDKICAVEADSDQLAFEFELENGRTTHFKARSIRTEHQSAALEILSKKNVKVI